MRLSLTSTLALTLTAGAMPALAAPQAAAPTRPDAEGFIRDWLVLAPVFYEGLWPAGGEEIDKQVVPGEASLRPKAGDKVKTGGAELSWKAAKSNAWGLDLAASTDAKDTKFKLGYAVAYITSDAAVKGARLRVGTNDLGKIYWNGKPVIRNERVRRLEKDQNAALVDLKKGVNVLVAKIINDETKWEVAARLVGAGGAPVPGLKVASTPDGKDAAAAPDAEGFVRDWLVLGPIAYTPRPHARGQLAKKQIANEEKLAPHPGETVWVNTGGVPWTAYKAKDYFIDFDEVQKTMRKYTPPARIEANDTLFTALGYAVTYVTAAKDMPGLSAKIGANDNGRLYVNGKVVVDSESPGKIAKDKAAGKVSLRKGVNTLVFKVVNAGDAWAGCARFVDKDGKPVTDLEVSTTPPPSDEQRLASE